MQLDMLVVGAGFAGIYQLYKAREAGMTVRVLEVDLKRNRISLTMRGLAKE